MVYNALSVINQNSTVLDLCTGSGAIAISIKKEKEAIVTAVDISKDALALAKENAEINGAEIEFVESDMFSGVYDRKFDVIISNPPYIKKSDIETLQVEVKDFEPMLALYGGDDGFDYYRIISTQVKNHLNEGGVSRKDLRGCMRL